MKKFFRTTFSSLKVRNYRLYYFGQIVSLSGTFLQTLAQDWLILKLTNSGVMLGLVSACQFMPMLILMPYGGVIADRFPKLRLLFATQSISGILSLLLGICVVTGTIQIWMIFVFAILLGLTNGVDYPSRQAFVYEMVGKDEIQNAVSLWSILVSVTRIIGPAIAGILIVVVGIGQCFIINGLSYIAVLVALFMIKTADLHIAARPPAARGQIREGFCYMKSTPILLVTLVQLAIVGTITFEWQASVPLFARFVLNGDARTYAIVTVAMSIGMLFGGLFTAQSNVMTEKRLVRWGFILGIVTLITAFSSNLFFAVIAFAAWGLCILVFTNICNNLLIVNADPKMRGRIMAFFNMAFSGSTAIGAPLIGWIGQAYGAQWCLVVGGVAALGAGVYGLLAGRRVQGLHGKGISEI